MVLKLELLGRLSLKLNDEPLIDLDSAKAQALLCYLAVNGRSFARQTLAGLLWDDMSEADARRNLRGVLMRLRQTVEPFLIISHQSAAFERSSDHWLDVAEFKRLLKRNRMADQGQKQEQMKGLRTAVSLYRGDFLEEFNVRQAPLFESWVAQERAILQGMVIGAYQTLAIFHEGWQEYEQAIADTRQLLILDPAQEEGHRQLMRLLASSGQRSAALAQYETCRHILADELGIEPTQATVDLYHQIRSETFKADKADDRLDRPRISITDPAAAFSSYLSPSPSPFIAGPPIRQPRQFFGRGREIRRIFNLLQRLPLQNAAIIGERRSGKTSLLHYLSSITTTPQRQLRADQRLDWLPRPTQFRWIFVDFQDPRLGSSHGLLRYLLQQLALPVTDGCDLDYFMDVVSDNLQSPTVILFDEIGVALERYPELDNAFWESLRSLATNQVGGNLAFILAAPDSPAELAQYSGYGSPFFNIFGYTAFLGPLSEAEAAQLIASSPRPFSDVDTAWILENSGRWPILLQILCRERLLALEEGETDDSWREEALRQIQPFLRVEG